MVIKFDGVINAFIIGFKTFSVRLCSNLSLLKEIDMDAFTVAFQLHQANFACFVGQAYSVIDLGPTPSIHQLRGQKEYL